ncbi:trypsin-like peptidase domain-containing protein [Actinomadura sp. NPDC047616]|uniref:S1C family serine protease n=1 Tax=Actinomadura sp. NPDC047616 TaxID=3155914 RepID=UPI00340F1905
MSADQPNFAPYGERGQGQPTPQPQPGPRSGPQTDPQAGPRHDPQGAAAETGPQPQQPQQAPQDGPQASPYAGPYAGPQAGPQPQWRMPQFGPPAPGMPAMAHPPAGASGGVWWTARRRLAAVGAAVALALGAGATGAVTALAVSGGETVYSSPTAVSGASNKNATATAQTAAAVQPSVVSIQAQTATGQTAGGSGVILRSDGVILTNAHVVEDTAQIAVKFSDGRTASARLLGADSSHDVALIKAEGVSGLKPATLGDSGALAVGDPVLAVGSPLGLDGSVTSGIVSALGRKIQEGDSQEQAPGLPPYLRGRLSQQQTTVIENAIQTDAAINPGNSGGALVNAAGQVVGINTAIATSGNGSGNIGVGFAIPINDAKKIADKIMAGGGV